MSWRLVYTKQAKKDSNKLAPAGLKAGERLLEMLKKDPYKTPLPFEKLVGDLTGSYSRRINIQHRLVYQAHRDVKTVKVLRMWTHYE